MISRWHASTAICDLVGISLREILERAEEHAIPASQLTLTQEREIIADPRLLFVTWLVLNRMPFDQITRDYRLTEAEVLDCFIRLDRLKVIELQPFNRVRLLVSRHFSWRPGGPVQRYINDRLLREFMATRFLRRTRSSSSTARPPRRRSSGRSSASCRAPRANAWS